MIPEDLTEEHFKLAAAEIDRDRVPRQRKSVHYDLVFNGQKYPPKYIISLATRYAMGKEFLYDDFNAVEAKNYFENRGYKIIDRRFESVKSILDGILPKENLQKKFLNIFSQSITCADESGSNKWGLHLLKNKARLLVGSMIVCTIQENEIWITLDKNKLELDSKLEDTLNKSPYWRWDTKGYPEFKRVRSRNGYYSPDDKNLELWNTINELHFEFIRNVADKFQGLQTKSQEKHDPELLTVIQDILGQSLPAPEHNSFDEQDLIEKLEKLNITETEKDAIIKSRIGQDKFRTRLKIFWNNRCAVTDCSLVDLTKASHIKPWRHSNNNERLDVYNGLLLTPNLDSAFDSGFISFDEDGSILISQKLKDKQKKVLGIQDQMSLSRIDTKHQKYLEFHRNHIYKKQ